jgi:hypothetical protein
MELQDKRTPDNGSLPAYYFKALDAGYWIQPTNICSLDLATIA